MPPGPDDEPDRSVRQTLLRGWRIATVLTGIACLVAAGFVLVKGDEGPLSECTTSTTRKLPAEQPAPSTGAPPIARPAPSVEDRALVVTEEVTKCEPTTLTGGLALLLGLAAVALILPAWVRAMPDGDLETPWVKLSKGSLVSKEEAREKAHDAFTQARVLASVNDAMLVAAVGLPEDPAAEEPAADAPPEDATTGGTRPPSG